MSTRAALARRWSGFDNGAVLTLCKSHEAAARNFYALFEPSAVWTPDAPCDVCTQLPQPELVPADPPSGTLADGVSSHGSAGTTPPTAAISVVTFRDLAFAAGPGAEALGMYVPSDTIEACELIEVLLQIIHDPATAIRFCHAIDFLQRTQDAPRRPELVEVQS